MRIAIILTALTLTGCASSRESLEKPTTIIGQYRLVRIDAKPVGRLGMHMTLDEQGRVSLAYDCGQQFARYEFKQSRITFDQQSPTGSICDSKSNAERQHLFYIARSGMIDHSYAVSLSFNRLKFSGWHNFEFELVSR